MIEQLELSSVLERVNELSSGNLKAKDDFERLVTLSIEFGKIDELKELAFQAKFIIGLIKIIRTNGAKDDEVYSLQLNDQFRVSYMKIQKLIRIITAHASKFIQDIFEEKYLHLSQNDLVNLNNLCSDLSFLKFYFNDLKTKKDSK